MPDEMDAEQSKNAGVSTETERELPKTTSKKDYLLLCLVTLIKLGDNL